MCKFCDDLRQELELQRDDGNASRRSPFMQKLWSVGKRLSKDPADNFALQRAESEVASLINMDIKRGGTRYGKYFPRYTQDGKKPRKDGTYARKGEIKKISFTSEFLCQKPASKYLKLYKTTKGVVVDGKYVCGKGWTCPVCGAKIAARRNEEIHIILNKAYKEKKRVFMVTFTAPHPCAVLDLFGDPTPESILDFSQRLQFAYVHLFNSKSWKKLKKEYSYFNYIKTMETMLGGRNGAHNHFHEIEIWDSLEIDAEKLRAAILAQWEKSCAKFGLLDPKNKRQVADFREHSIDVKQDFDPDYISKQSTEWQREHGVSENWGAAEEMTLSRQKKGYGSVTPNGYLATICRKVYAGFYVSEAEVLRDLEVYIEYACAMVGRQMIKFGDGLKEWAGLKDKTDQEIVEEMQDSGNVVGGFDADQYNFIRRNFLWKPLKKALFEDTDKAIAVLNEVFEQNGLRPFYSSSEIQSLAIGDCWFSSFLQPRNAPQAVAAGG